MSFATVPTQELLDRLLRRGVAEVIPEQELRERLASGKPLRLKQGFDPSAPDIHLGHVVGLRKLRQLQELGHQVILIVGDWTAQIGDPSGRSATRKMLTAEEVRANAESYLQQFFKVVDKAKTQVVWQSEWFGKFTLADVIQLTRKFTVAQLIQRDDFAKRYAANLPIAITEFLYPLLQAYDSVEIKADVEFGGTDQKFNILLGRELQSMVGQRPQDCLLVPLLVGTDGQQKMSKSLGNYIGVAEPPGEMYGKVMSIPDALIFPYYELLTDVPDEKLIEIQRQLSSHEQNPMVLKKHLGREIVAIFHGWPAANAAEKDFETKFQRRETPAELPVYRFDAAFLEKHKARDHEDALDAAGVLVDAGLAPSKAEARRLIAQGAVEADGVRLMGEQAVLALKHGTIVRVGKRRFLRFEKG